MRVFLDANVLFSAAKSDGAVRRLMRMLVEAGHACCADAYVMGEAERNLAAKGPEALEVFRALAALLQMGAATAASDLPPEAHWLPEKDRPVLAAAMRMRCDVLVTGDRTHFGAGYGKVFGGVFVHSPASLAQALAETPASALAQSLR